jgi:23S rRNA pseudouridine1911/1915/1917 synthase
MKPNNWAAKAPNKSTKSSDLLFQVTENTELMVFLIAKMPHKSRVNIKTILRDKQVLVDGRATTQFNHPLIPGQEVTIKTLKAYQEKPYKGLSIIFEDQHLIVINKDEGMLSISTDKEKELTAYSILSNHVKKTNPANRIFVVHRLDRETSGLMMYAKSEKVQKLLQESWHATKERIYLAVTEGKLPQSDGTVESYLVESKAFIVYSSQNPNNGQKAITHYQTLKSNNNYSLVKVTLETGRKNQVRVHMQDLGHPVIGDAKYGSKVNPIKRLGLHAWVLTFVHPVTKESLHFETPIPKKFTGLF